VSAGGAIPHDDPRLSTIFDGLGFVTPAALELIVNRARRAARRARPEPLDVVRVEVDELGREASRFVPEGSNAKLRLQTLEAVLYANDLDYLPEPWKTRVKESPEELARERDALRKLVGYA
jgi:hypothetical protein